MGRSLDGGARQVANLLNGLERFADEHVLVCASGAEIAGAISSRSVKISRVKSSDLNGLKFVKALRKIIRYERPDLLHIHSRPGDMLAALAGRLEKRPMVYSVRSDKKPGLSERYLKLPLFGRIITLSQGIHRVLQESRVPGERLVCIPGAVDTDRFRPDKQGRESFLAQFGLRGDGPVLATVAQLAPHKGHAVLFAALPAVLAKRPTARLLVFGQGPLKAQLAKEINRRGLDRYVLFAGFRPDLENVLPHIDLLIHPALSEGVGVCLMEAAACGVPIIASRVGGIPEIVRDRFNGYLVKPGDSPILARHIIDLLDDEDQLRLFGKTGRELALENHSIERMANAHRALYRNI